MADSCCSQWSSCRYPLGMAHMIHCVQNHLHTRTCAHIQACTHVLHIISLYFDSQYMNIKYWSTRFQLLQTSSLPHLISFRSSRVRPSPQSLHKIHFHIARNKHNILFTLSWWCSGRSLLLVKLLITAVNTWKDTGQDIS